MDDDHQSEKWAARTMISEIAHKSHDRNQEDIQAARQAARDAATMVVRSLLLVNGGAVIALMAFIGSVEASDAGPDSVAALLVSPLSLFAIGVGAAIISGIFTYATNAIDGDIFSSVKLTMAPPFVEATPKRQILEHRRRFYFWLGIAATIASTALFFVGVIAVGGKISSMGI